MRALLLAGALLALPAAARAEEHWTWSENDGYYSALICTNETVARAIGDRFKDFHLRSSFGESPVSDSYIQLASAAISLHYCEQAPPMFQIREDAVTTPVAMWWHNDVTLTLTRSSYYTSTGALQVLYAFRLGEGA